MGVLGRQQHLPVGSFDGFTFHAEQGPRKLQPDGNGYAAQTWSDVPPEDGRRL